LVFGQNYDANSKDEIKYQDIMGFHFDSNGIFKVQYGVDTKQSNKDAENVGANQSFVETVDGKTVFWLLMEVKGATEEKLLIYPRIAKIDLASAKVSDFTDFGQGAYFLDPRYPFLSAGTDQIAFFGSTANGKALWFCRVNLK
jgi:hypothetical protein